MQYLQAAWIEHNGLLELASSFNGSGHSRLKNINLLPLTHGARHLTCNWEGAMETAVAC
jgi:hypothetical protein